MSDYLPSEAELDALPHMGATTPAAPAPEAAKPRPQRGYQRADELPPHSTEAEAGVLGCILLEPSASMDVVSEKLSRPGPSAFYDLRHRAIYESIYEMWDKRVAIDVITLMERLRNAGTLDEVGGMPFIASLQDAVPSAAHIDHYVAIVMEKWTCRNLVQMGADIIQRARNHQGDVDGLVADIQTSTLALADGHVTAGPKRGTTIIRTVYEQMEKAMRGRQQITGLKTGLHYFDNMTCGLQAGEMVVIGARPSVGKTALGVTMALEVLRGGHTVLFFSVEMADVPIMHRFLGAAARVDTRTIRNGFLSDKAKRNIVAFQAESAEWMKRLYIDTRSDINGRDLFVSTRRAIREHGVNLVVVDYLQLMSAVRPSDSRVNDVAEISRWVKRTAKDLNVAVVALAQLGRESVKVKNARPTMADLRESGQIEQDADIIGLLYRPDLGREPDYDSMSWIQHHEPWCPKENSGWFGEKITLPGPQGASVTYPEAWREELDFIRLDVAKNRQGETGECDLVFQKRATAFCDAFRPDYGKKHQQAELIGGEEV